MPLYSFQSPTTGEIIDIYFGMNDPKEYRDSEGVLWERVWEKPHATVHGNSDPFDSKAFVEKTRNMKGTVGDLWDMSRELSEKRGGKENDPIRKDALKKNSAERGGKEHLSAATDGVIKI